MADEQRKLSFEEALAILDRHAAEADDKYKSISGDGKAKATKKVKDLIKAGAKQGRAGLGRGTRKQLDALDKEGY